MFLFCVMNQTQPASCILSPRGHGVANTAGTHAGIYIYAYVYIYYIYIYIYMCVCVCVCVHIYVCVCVLNGVTPPGLTSPFTMWTRTDSHGWSACW